MRQDSHRGASALKEKGRLLHSCWLRWLLPAAGLFLLIGSALPAFAAGGDVIWQFGDAIPGKQEAKASVADSQGNVIITGYQNLSGNNDDYYTVKFKGDGSGVAWRAIFDKAGGSDQGTAVVVDRDDNIIVTGLVWNGLNNDIHTAKYDGATGAVIWQHTYNSSANGNDVGTSLAVDSLNNVYVGGYSQDGNGNYTYLVLKYSPTGPNPDGKPVWQAVADGATTGINRVNSIAAGNSGIVVTGQTWNGSAFDILTVKFDLNGAKQWERRYSTGAANSCFGKYAKMDQSDDVVITGTASNGTDLDIYTAKYNGTTGAVVWERTYNGAYDDEPNGIAIGPNGNVYITGYTWTLTAQNDFYTAKYNGATGALIWEKTFNSGNGNDDITAATGIVIDPLGDLFATGYTIDNKNYNFQTIKYKKDNGNQLWQKSFNGPADKNDRPIGIGLSPTGEVLVAGWSDTAVNDLDYYVIKYDPGLLDPPTSVTAQALTNSSVTLTWVDNSSNEDGFSIERCQNDGCTSFTEVATTAAGVTTYMDSGLTPTTYYSYRIRAFSATAGYSHYSNTATALTVVVNFVPPVWTYVYSGLANNDDFANAIAVGPDNNPVVAGQSNDYPLGYSSGLTSFDYLLVKLNRTNMAVIWSDRYDDPTNAADIATCVAVDSNNGVVVSGYATLFNGTSTDVNSLYTIRYPASGPPALRSDQYNGPVAGGATDDRAVAVAIASASDTSNNVVVVGYGMNAVGNDDIYVVKYNPDGSRAWAATPFDGNGGDDFPTSVVLALDGSIYVTGYSETAANSNVHNFFTARYDGTTGARIWTDVFNVTGSSDNRGANLTLDAAGDLYVTGYARNAAGNKDVYTIKYKGGDTTAQHLWERSLDGIAHGDDEGVAVRIDPVDGAVVVAGTTLSGTDDHDFTLARYTASGDTVWTKTYQRPANDDFVKTMGIDADGNIYVAGNTSNGSTTDSFTVKFDYMGNIVAATLYNGAANSFDESTALVVNSVNEVFVAGYTENASGNADFLVYKIAPDATLPSVPYAVSVVAGYATVTLNWSDRSAVKDGFRIERRVGACSSANTNPWQLLGTVAATTLTFADSGLNTGSTYCYHIQSFLNSGVVSRWAEKQVTTLSPAAPANVAATVVNTTQINITWSDTTTGETGFRIERCGGSGCTDFATVGTAGANATNYTDTTVCSSTVYRYRVLAYGTGWESPSGTTATEITTPSPKVPVLSASRISEAEIDLSWTDQNTDETGYIVERCIGDSCTGFTTLATLAANTVLFKDTGLAAGTTYVYRIKGYKTATCTWEILSNTATATSTLNPPGNLTATPDSTTTVNLSWTDNTVSETGFSIEKCVGDGCNSFDQLGNVGANVTSYADTSACTGESATYRVKSTRGTVTLSNGGGSCWTRRIPLTINNFQSNYQMKLTIPYDSDMQASFADIRFVDTAGGIEIPYWVESKTDGTSATVWIKTGINNTIALYFGNSIATSSSSGTSVFEFFDEFNGGTLDTATWNATGAYSLTGGALRVDTGSVYSKATVTATPQNRVFEMKSQWLTGASSYSGINIANAQSTQGSNTGTNALAYFITDGGTTANLLPFGANGSAASYNIASGSLSSTISTGSALYNPFISNYQSTRKPASGVWSPPSGGNITRIHITNASESGYDYFNVYNAAGTLLWRGAGTADTWLDVAPTTGIYTVFTTDGSVQAGVGGNVPEVVVDGISAVNALNNYRIVGFEFQGTSQLSYFVKELDYTDVLRKTYSGTWNAAPYLWLGYFMGAASGTSDGDDMVVDWVRVRKYAATEPAATFGGKESSDCFTFGSPWDGTYTNTASATTPQPTTPVLTATRVSEVQINLSWTDTNADRSGFSLERCAGDGCSDFTVIAASIPANSTSYSDTGLTLNTSYTYRLEVFKTAPCGWSKPSLPVSAVTTLLEPNNVAATANNTTQITVAWADRTGSETGFKILRCQGSGCTPDPTPIGTAAANATSYVDTSVAENTVYNYQVVATNSTIPWDSAISTKVERATPAPSAPVLSSVSRGSEVQVNLSWTDSNTDRTGFRLYRCAGGGCSNFAQLGGTITATTYNDTGLAPNTSYTYYVETFKTVTTERWARQSGQLSATTTLLEPNNVTATANNTTQITVAWADRTASETGFKILRCQGSGCTPDATSIGTAVANATSYVDTSVAENTTYNYQVVATNSTVPWDSILSAKVERATLAAVAPVLNATSPSEVQINLTWNDSATDETGYKVFRCAGSDCSNFALATGGTLAANATSFNDTGLTTGTSYSYQVHVYKTATNSWDKVSNTMTLTPQVASPTNLKAATVNTTAINLAWTNTTTSETGFEVERWDGAAFVQIGIAAAHATTFSDPSVCSGQTYTYRVRAINSTVPWNSAYSNMAAGITPSFVNLLADPGFENTTSGWPTAVGTLTGTSFDTSTHQDGGTSLRLAATGVQLGRSQSVPVIPGRQYVLSGWLNTALTAGTALCDVYGTGIDSQGISIASNSANNNAGWVNLSETVTIPPGTTSASIRCFADTSTQGTAYFDAISFAPADFILTAARTSEVQINLSWPDSVVDETGYKVERCTGSTCADTDFMQIGTAGANATSYTNTGLAVNTTYTYRIRGYKTATCAWDGSYSAIAAATTTIAAPTGFNASAANTTTVNLTWTDNTVSETGFKIERCAGSDCSDFAEIYTTAANATSYGDTNVASGTTYQYRIRATNSTLSWNSDYASSAPVTPPAPSTPSGLAANRGSDETKMNLIWTDKATDETGYKVERCEGTGCSNFVLLNGTLAANTSSYSDTGLKGNTTYTYRVSAFKTATNSWTASSTTEVTTTVTPPSSLAAQASTSTQVNLTWTDNTASETGFRIERCIGSGCSNFAEIYTAAANAVSYADTSVTSGTTYRYQIRATNSTLLWDSGYSAIVEITIPAQGTPTGLTTTSFGSRVTLNWTRNTIDETGFTIQRCTGSACADTDYSQIGQTGANIVTFQDNTVCSGTAYSYRVSAYRTSYYTTPYSTPTTVTPAAALPVVTAARGSEAQINVSWTDANPDKNGFRLERCIESGCSNFIIIADNLAATVLTYSDTGLLPNYSYTYRVKGYNNTATCGWDTTSVPVSQVTMIPTPTGLTATAVGMSQINLSWTDTTTTKTGSRIERCTGSGCSNFTEIGAPTGNATTWSDTGLAAGTSYSYRVRATKTTPYAWDSDYSNSATASTQAVPAAPTGLSAQAASANQIDLTWSDTSAADGYYIESCTGTSCTNFTQIANLPVTPKSYSKTGLAAATTYCYRVRGYKTNTWTSAYSVTSCADTTIDSPATLSATATNSMMVQLTWIDSTADVNGYNLESQVWNGEWVVVASLGPDVTSYTDAVGIEPLKAYTYRIRAFKGAQYSSYSNQATASTPAFSSGDSPCVTADVNAPSITSTPITTATEGVTYTYQVAASAMGNRTFSYLLVVKPMGMTISPTGLISWVPTYGQAGNYNVTVRVIDSAFHMADQHFSVTVANVNNPPSITSSAITAAVELHPYSYQIVATDPEGDALSYSLTTAPTGMSINSVGLISWTPATAQFGDNAVTVAVSDGSLSATQSFTINVGNNRAPTVSSTPPITAAEGNAYSYQVVASDPDGDPLSYTLTAAPAGMTISTSGLITWTPTQLQAQTGSAAVAVQVSDGSLSALQNFTITVSLNHTPVIISTPATMASEGVAYSYSVLAYAPVSTDTLTYSLTTAPAGMTINSAGVVNWTPVIGQGGSSIPITVIVQAGGAIATQSFTIAAPYIAAPPTQRASVGTAYSYTATANVAGRTGTIVYSLVTPPTGMTINGSTGVINWTPAAGQAGSNSVTVKATIGSYTPTVYATRIFTIAVPSITSSAVTTAVVGSAYSYTVTATDPIGGTFSYALTNPPTGMTINSSTGVISWTPATGQSGNVPVTVTATVGGAVATQAFTISVLKITSTPITSAYIGWQYGYQVTTAGTPIGYSLDTAPSGMTINVSTGAVTWVPVSGQTGSNAVTVKVTTSGNLYVTQSFTITVASVPPAPTLTSPANSTAYSGGYAGSGPLVTFTWNPITSDAQYYVRVSTDATFATTNYTSGWVTGASWQATIVPGATAQTYYWQVQARDPASLQTTSWSGSWSLSVTDTCGGDTCCGDLCCLYGGSYCGSSSCPLVYSYNGAQYGYESDLQGPAISPIKKGARNVTLYQPSYIVLEDLAADSSNQYRVKIWESLQEATMLDEAKLLAVDYPQGYEIVSSMAENTYYYGYVDPFRIYTIKEPVPPVTATDKYGTDILASVLDVDDNPARMVPDDPDNYYTFDFGAIQHPENAKLVIDAWQIINSKIYTSTVTIQPYIEVMDTNGAWVKVKSFGMPAGDLKTMVIDLSNKFLSTDHRVRVHLGIKKAQVWVIDRIRLDDSAPVNVAVQELQASSADLQTETRHAIEAMNTLQHRIIVSEGNLTLNTSYFGYGNFTRLGEVGELLTQRDDKYVIMNYADKLELKFPALPAPQAGMTRGFILKADLYYKDFKDYNYIEPLPFHGMSDYPYPATEAYPTDADHEQYRLDYNTRVYPQ